MTAWVLVWALGLPQAIAIPGIASERACTDLAERLGLQVKWQCISYEAASSGQKEMPQ